MAKTVQDRSPETRHEADAAADICQSHRIATDTVNRLNVKADGTMEWGAGNAAVDTSLSRTAANTLGLASGDTLTADVVKTTANGTKTAVAVALNDADTGLFLQAANTLGAAAGGVEGIRLASSAASGELGLMLLGLVGGTTTLFQVSMNAVDTAGTGYRGLRIINTPA